MQIKTPACEGGHEVRADIRRRLPTFFDVILHVCSQLPVVSE